VIFRQLFDRATCTYTYLLADAQTLDAVLIDPVRDLVDRDMQLLAELDLQLKYTLETHVHADHVTGSSILRAKLGSRSVVSRAGGAPCADVPVDHGDVIRFGRHALHVRSTPGHTNGCVTYVLDDHSRAFTGDTLLIRGCGRTDFQEGSPESLYASVHSQIFSLPDDCQIFPGHDYKGSTSSTVAEEKAHNPRLKVSNSVEQFAAIMEGLNLNHPARIHVAVPANLRCGWLADDGDWVAPEQRDDRWAPIVRTPGGVPEVGTGFAADLPEGVRLVDVRRPEEIAAGWIPGADFAQFELLDALALPWDRSQPVVLICKAGGRSARSAALLERMGFTQVASVRGGMTAWEAEGRPLQR
jgi:glyoxylase-like metal-dependent hydrolase (beta-lactamase superfamily II)/rhodanese-related sulfurtransferase